MNEMMMAKLMALKKLKRKMHELMMHEKEECDDEGMPEMKMESLEEYALDDDPMDMHNEEDREEELMIPKGRTRTIVGGFMKPKKNVMSMSKKV